VIKDVVMSLEDECATHTHTHPKLNNTASVCVCVCVKVMFTVLARAVGFDAILWFCQSFILYLITLMRNA